MATLEVDLLKANKYLTYYNFISRLPQWFHFNISHYNKETFSSAHNLEDGLKYLVICRGIVVVGQCLQTC